MYDILRQRYFCTNPPRAGLKLHILNYKPALYKTSPRAESYLINAHLV